MGSVGANCGGHTCAYASESTWMCVWFCRSTTETASQSRCTIQDAANDGSTVWTVETPADVGTYVASDWP
eukprot:10731500-Heterocapsa_arctica.AAC.1